MPLCTKPGQLFPYTFPCDRDLPVSTRPTVMCKAISARDGEKWWAELFACDTLDKADAKMAENVVSVSGMGDIKDVATLLAKITQEEREDMAVCISRGILTERQRKNS
jgi:hypothetical protein